MFEYDYDVHNRVISKKVPGAEEQIFTYTDADLVKNSLDGNGNLMSFVYDDYNRQTQMYLKTGESSIPSSGGPFGDLMTENTYGESQGTLIYIGKLWKSSSKLLDGSGQFVENTNTYDPYGRLSSYKEDYFLHNDPNGKTDTRVFGYNHADWMLQNTLYHGGYQSINVQTTQSYDQFGRVLSRTFAPGTSSGGFGGLSTRMRYNDRDEMIFRGMGVNGNRYYERQNMKYHVRGWLTHINEVRPKISDYLSCTPSLPPDDPTSTEESLSVNTCELLDYLSSGEEVTINELDPCATPQCYERLRSYHITLEPDFCINSITDSKTKSVLLSGFPYCNLANQQNLDNLIGDLITWLNQQSFSYESVTGYVDPRSKKVVIDIKKTTFQLGNIYGDCLKTVSFNADFMNANLFGLEEVGGSLNNPMDYPYCSYGETGEKERLINDLEAWLTQNGYQYGSVRISRFSGMIMVSIDSTDFRLSSVELCADCPTRGNCTNPVSGDFFQEDCVDITKIEHGLLPCKDDGKTTTFTPVGSYPKTKYKAVFPNGTAQWVYEWEIGTLTGDFQIQDRVHIKSATSKFEILKSDGTTVVLTEAGLDSQDGELGRTIDYDPTETPEPECDEDPLPCSQAEQEEQAEDVNNIQNLMANLDCNTLEFPVNLYLVKLCDGSTVYILTDKLLNQLSGTYQILDTLEIDDEDDVIDILVVREDPLYSMEFEHEANGNISKAKWKVTDHVVNYYNYSYDVLNRLMSADYGEITMTESANGLYTSINDNLTQLYRVYGISYDGVGNILSLNRKGMVPVADCFENHVIDALSYSYNAEGHLINVGDGAPTPGKPYGFDPGTYFEGNDAYVYDNNGNLIEDRYKELDITYNFLNLPKQIQKGSANLDIVYDASGRKWWQDGPNGVKQYVNGIEYEGTTIESFMDQDGRVVPVVDGGSTTYRSEYFIKDHLGNVRLSFADLNNNGKIEYDNPATLEVMQENHYYPFGLNHLGPWYESVGPVNKYKFNGIEKIEELAVGWDLAAFRSYDAAIGRWTQIDPLTESVMSESPYGFCFNNPTRFSDPLGLMGEEVGADGLTNSQWLNSSRPNSDPSLANSYRYQNRQDEINRNRLFSAMENEENWEWNPHAGEETGRILGEHGPLIFFSGAYQLNLPLMIGTLDAIGAGMTRELSQYVLSRGYNGPNSNIYGNKLTKGDILSLKFGPFKGKEVARLSTGLKILGTVAAGVGYAIVADQAITGKVSKGRAFVDGSVVTVSWRLGAPGAAFGLGYGVFGPLIAENFEPYIRMKKRYQLRKKITQITVVK